MYRGVNDCKNVAVILMSCMYLKDNKEFNKALKYAYLSIIICNNSYSLFLANTTSTLGLVLMYFLNSLRSSIS